MFLNPLASEGWVAATSQKCRLTVIFPVSSSGLVPHPRSQPAFCPFGSVCVFRKVKVKSLSRVRLFVTLWTVAHQAPPSMGFSRQEHWSGVPFPSPGESSQPRDWSQVSRIAGRRFNLWATRAVSSRISYKWTFRLVLNPAWLLSLNNYLRFPFSHVDDYTGSSFVFLAEWFLHCRL